MVLRLPHLFGVCVWQGCAKVFGMRVPALAHGMRASVDFVPAVHQELSGVFESGEEQNSRTEHTRRTGTA